MASITMSPAVRPASPVRVAQPQMVRRTVLTARGRRVLSALVLSVVMVAGYLFSSLFGAVAHAGTEAVTGVTVQQVVVQPGQTLWSLAKQVDPAGDVRVTIDRIAELNSIASDSVLIAGSTLLLPLD